MRTIKYQLIFGLVVILLLQACATYNAQYEDENYQSTMPSENIEHSFYLIGDAGASDMGSKSIALQAFEKELKKADKNSTALFLGDNIYQRGLVDKDHPNHALATHRIEAQTSVAKDFQGRPIFIPGNHDWYSGLKGLKRHEQYG